MMATLVIIIGSAFAAMESLGADNVDVAFSRPAMIAAVTIALALLVEAQGGLRNLVRLDLFMIAVLFLLTFAEFLLPQDSLVGRVTLEGAQTAVVAVLLGFCGIAVGRFAFPARRPLGSFANFSVSPRDTMMLLTGCTFLGYLYMLLAVNFDLVEMIHQMMRPRFSQPWTRGRYGSLSTLLNELALLTYLLPPLVAAVLAQAERYALWQKLFAVTILLFVFFDGFASGTRNVFLTHLVTFGTTYTILLPKLTIRKAAMVAVPTLIMAAVGIQYMLDVRTVGFQGLNSNLTRPTAVFVDMNLVNIAGLTDVFPDLASHLGFEVPLVAIVRPIPRALWPGKPEGLSFSIEEALGTGSNMTLSATFVGEFWMAGGHFAILLAALFFGAVAGWWNRVGVRSTSNLELILFASAFFPAGIAMRSFMSAAPPALPVIALALAVRHMRRRRRRP
jgi:oligosaccharide repeat unit polymerase